MQKTILIYKYKIKAFLALAIGKSNLFLDIETHESLMTPVELIVELHKIKTTNFKEHGHLVLSKKIFLYNFKIFQKI